MGVLENFPVYFKVDEKFATLEDARVFLNSHDSGWSLTDIAYMQFMMIQDILKNIDHPYNANINAVASIPAPYAKHGTCTSKKHESAEGYCAAHDEESMTIPRCDYVTGVGEHKGEKLCKWISTPY